MRVIVVKKREKTIEACLLFLTQIFATLIRRDRPTVVLICTNKSVVCLDDVGVFSMIFIVQDYIDVHFIVQLCCLSPVLGLPIILQAAVLIFHILPVISRKMKFFWQM